MKANRIRFTTPAILILLSVFLIAAGYSRVLETDSGNILIHDIIAESYEAFPYGARLFRPLVASSLNRRPSVLLVVGNMADRYTCDHISMELARRGFVALTIEDFGQGSTGEEPDFETENMIDAGYTFLATRSFADPERIGLAAFYAACSKAPQAESLSKFSSRIFISPSAAVYSDISDGSQIYTAQYETDPEYQLRNDSAPDIRVFPLLHEGMLTDAAVISAMMDQYHEDLAIPNDSPLWFDAKEQNAEALLGIRAVLLVLLFVICAGVSALITGRTGGTLIRAAAGIFLPLILFTGISALMNFFIISVRLGSPFHYVPGITQIIRFFSLPRLLIFIAAVLLLNIPLGRRTYVTDLTAGVGFIACLALYLYSRRTAVQTEAASIKISAQNILTLISLYALLDCFLVRIIDHNKQARLYGSIVTGAMFYLACANIHL